jgi:hypothetical protein
MKHFPLTGLAVIGLATAAVAFHAAPAAAFSTQDPGDILSVLSSNGASGDLKKDDKGKPYIDAKAGNLSFEIDFSNCNDRNTNCTTTMYSTGWNMTSVNVDQINRWNRWAMFCPAYLSTQNHPRAWYPVKNSPNGSREDAAREVGVWLDCLSDFDKFTDNPETFLKAQE